MAAQGHYYGKCGGSSIALVGLVGRGLRRSDTLDLTYGKIPRDNGRGTMRILSEFLNRQDLDRDFYCLIIPHDNKSRGDSSTQKMTTPTICDPTMGSCSLGVITLHVDKPNNLILSVKFIK